MARIVSSSAASALFFDNIPDGKHICASKGTFPPLACIVLALSLYPACPHHLLVLVTVVCTCKGLAVGLSGSEEQ